MKKTIGKRLLWVMAGLIFAGVMAAEAAVQTKEELIANFIKAVNSDNPQEVKALIHPRCLELINDDTQPYFESLIANDLRHTIPEDARIHYTPFTGQDSLLFAAMGDFPVRPTEQVTIEYNESEWSSVSMIRWIVKDGAGWHFVILRPKLK